MSLGIATRRPLRPVGSGGGRGIELARAGAENGSGLEARAGIVFSQLTGARNRNVPGIPHAGANMLAAQHYAGDGVIGKPNRSVEAGGAPVAIQESGGSGIGVVVQRIHPTVSEIHEVGVKPAQVNVGTFSEFVVGAPGETPTAAIVAILAFIDAIEPSRAARKGGGDVRDGFNVVDAATIPVVGEANQCAEALFGSEALAHGSGRLDQSPPIHDRSVATHPTQSDRGPLTGRLGNEVYGAADAVGIHVGLQGLVDFHGFDDVCRYGIQLDLARIIFR